jgi:hypothetical protein
MTSLRERRLLFLCSRLGNHIMAEPPESQKKGQPSPRQPRRESAADRSQERTDYSAGAHGTQRVDTPQAEAPGSTAQRNDGQLGPDEISEPEEVIKNNEAKLHQSDAKPDHSEREGGGDQDIDTAGLVPGNKATEH